MAVGTLGKYNRDVRKADRFERFFRALGNRIRELRRRDELTQENMGEYGFAPRHWQLMESGRHMNVETLFRICDVFGVSLGQLMHGLDTGLHRKPKRIPPGKKRR